ncbi:MAG: trypsin-like peptidase domain-containing protein [Candidatus Omnitrophota bacterium]
MKPIKNNSVKLLSRAIHYLVLLCFMTVCLSCFQGNIVGAEDQAGAEKAVTKAIKAVEPALVRIHVVWATYEEGREINREQSGSGTIIARDGYVITNHHVAGKANRITCTLANKEEIEGKLVGTDPLTDIAIIKLLSRGQRAFPFARFGDSSLLKVGEQILAMGCPYELSQSVTTGIVSNRNLVMPVYWASFILEGENVGELVSWIGHDAAIYPGNSGGPLVNLNGEIVGINEIRLGLSGAIPGNLAKEVSDQIIKYGKVSRSWIGLSVQPLLKSFNREEGILVSGTIEGSPADKAGFQTGDILIEVSKKPVSARFAEELPSFNQTVAKIPAGKEVEAVVLRNDKKIVLKITTQEREPAEPKEEVMKDWGLCVSNISLLTSKKLKRESKDGVLVKNGRPGGPCDKAEPPIIRNDVITRVANTAVKNTEELVKLTENLMKDRKDPLPVLVEFARENQQYITVVKLGVQESEDKGLEAKKSWLPIDAKVLTRDIAEQLGVPDLTGVIITYVYPESAAEKAGLKPGDIISSLNGDRIAASNPEDSEVLPALIRQYKAGAEVELTMLRGKEEKKVKIELPFAPKLPREMKRYTDKDFGFTARDMALVDQVKGNIKDESGVLVETVEQGSWVALGKMSVGDIILRIDGQTINNVGLLQQILKKAAADKPKRMIFLVKRGIHNLYLEMEPEW